MNVFKFVMTATIFFAYSLSSEMSVATPIIYSDLNDFQAARSNFISDASTAGISLSLDNFNDVPAGTASIPSITRADFTITHTQFNIRTENPLFNQSGTVNNTGGIAWDFTGGVDEYLLFTFNTPINAFGIDLIDFGDTGTDSNPKLYLNLGSNDILALNVTGDRLNGDEQFVGVIDTMSSFSSVAIRTENLDGNDTILGDDVRYGAAVTVPEPTTLVLMGLGLAGIGYRRDKKAA